MATGRLPDPNTAPVTAKGDLYTYSTVPAKLAVGNNGETLVADSSTSTGLRWQGSTAAGKNGIINGAFDIWQRGTSFNSTTAAGVYTADRWLMGGNSGHTYSRISPGSTLPQFTYGARLQRNSGVSSTNWLQIYNNLETQDSLRFAGQTVVVSFYARRSSTFTGSNIVAEVLYGTGTDQKWYNYTGLASAGSTSATLTTSWQRFSFTASIPTTATEVAPGFTISTFSGTAGADDWAEVTGVQMEIGSVATVFTRAGGTLAGELAACQRYYEVSNRTTPNGSGNSASIMGLGQATLGSTTTTFGMTNVKFSVPKRDTPTVTVLNGTTAGNVRNSSTGANVGIGTYSLSGLSDAGFHIVTAQTAVYTCGFSYDFNWIASAEL